MPYTWCYVFIMVDIDTMRYNAHFIKVALDGFLALPKNGGELHDKREYKGDDDIVLFEKQAVYQIVKDLSFEIYELSKKQDY